ncbi:acyltransferase [Pleionea litopenaei]|uniref:Acyltransferase n=1 Tax=Pleionea litopenaei TaxID=3070815 RepID=A0AA51RTE0_9GAMM|nr:acyltransferase [Pleionea sp. HL-JVS1]WMS87286.1 acyltransferase [Pleionea sp. HL-JVS1]
MKNVLKQLFANIWFVFVLIRLKIFSKVLGFKYVCRMITLLDERLLVNVLRSFGAKIGENVDIGYGIMFHNCKDFRNLTIGDNCHIGKECFFDLRDRVSIGNGVVISMRTTFLTHIDMTKSELSKYYQAYHAPVVIQDNVYIGAVSTVLSGVEIDANSLIGANSLVNKSCLPNSIYIGVPAKLKKAINFDE